MRFIALFCAALFSAGALMAEDNPAIPERPALLKALDGEWVMSGDVMGKPVTYRMVAGPTLQGAFTEIHMNDVQVPSQYEARVLVGHDADGASIVVHWLDSFGGKYSIPHGTGALADDAIQFTIPYREGAFRDTFTYDAKSNTWLFVLEAAQPDGTWKHFARYDVRRAD